jgi:hypothetical protein
LFQPEEVIEVLGEFVGTKVGEEVEGGARVDFHDLFYKLSPGEDFGVFPAFDGLTEWFWLLGCCADSELIESELHGFVLGAAATGLSLAARIGIGLIVWLAGMCN